MLYAHCDTVMLVPISLVLFAALSKHGPGFGGGTILMRIAIVDEVGMHNIHM